MPATLKLTRRSFPLENFNVVGRRPFEITLDGTVVGTLHNRETVEMAVDAGHHTLHLSEGRRISPSRSFDSTDGETVAFSCHGSGSVLRFLASVVRPVVGISLERS